MLRKRSPETFDKLSADQLKSFEKLIHVLTSAAILPLPQHHQPYSADTDASDHRIGCILYQINEEIIRYPIGYFSQALHAVERKHSTTENECFAVVWALQTLRPHLTWEHFTIFTDRDSLHWLLNVLEPSGRLIRWRLRLPKFNFDIQFKKEIGNCQADALSRLQTNANAGLSSAKHDILTFEASDVIECDFIHSEFDKTDNLLITQPTTTEEPVHEPIDLTTLIQEQVRDLFCRKIREHVNGGPHLSFRLREDGLLQRRVHSKPVVAIPESSQERVVHTAHHTQIGGHPGGQKMFCYLCNHFYWPSMSVDVYNVVKNCTSCARERFRIRKHATELKLLPATEPLTYVRIDIISPLMEANDGNTALLVKTDRFPKLTKTVPLRTTTAQEIAAAFTKKWGLLYGSPIKLLADN